MDKRTIELIQGAIDGVLTAAETRELEIMLQDDPEAAALYQDLLTLSDTIPTLKSEQPPADLKEGIMNTINTRAGSAPIHSLQSYNKNTESYMSEVKNQTMKIAASITGLVIIAAVIVYVTVDYPQPSPGDVAGTLSGPDGVERAERYRQTQIQPGDIELDNADIQDLLQSDDFNRLLETGTLQELANNAAFNELLMHPAAFELMSNAAFVELMQNERYALMAQSFFELEHHAKAF